jgi:hypothetical protein
MKGATVSGATLPSGLKIPSGGNWVLDGMVVVNKAPSSFLGRSPSTISVAIKSMLEGERSLKLVVVVLAAWVGVLFGFNTLKILLPVILLALGLADTGWRAWLTGAYAELGKVGPILLLVIGFLIVLGLVPDNELSELQEEL